MAKFIITRINKSSRRTKVEKERVEFKIWPLIVCFVLAFCFWLYIVGEEIRRNDMQNPEGTENFSVRAESVTDDTVRQLVAVPGTAADVETSGQTASAPDDAS